MSLSEVDPTLWARTLSTACFDWSVAFACGCVLSILWLGPRSMHSADDRFQPVHLGLAAFLRQAAMLLVATLVVQFYLLASTMSAQWALHDVLPTLPLVAETHAGRVTLLTLLAAAVLLLASFLDLRTRVGLLACSAALVLILFFHAATGHAANDGDYTLGELLQFFHLLGMALWSGGVLLAGLFVAPRLTGSRGKVDAGYLQALSNVSTWSVGVVLITGAIKGWTGLEGHPSGLIDPGWGRILLFKLFLVAVVLGLGLLHRLWIGQRDRVWTRSRTARLLSSLKAEAVCLSLVIAVSAWLSSVEPK